MIRLITTAIASTVILISALSCGRSEESPKQDAVPATGPAVPLDIDITVRTDPDPPKSGSATIEANVKGSNGQPVTDAEVSAEFYMAPMPEMKMPEMRNAIALRHQGGGRYRVTGNIAMAGKWEMSVTVKRDGQEVGKRTVTVTAH